jgi:TRAP-type C4-dicarboxylate transport system permease large subunit
MLSLGFSPIWFGIICVKYAEMANITPPVGLTLYATKSAAPTVPISKIIRGAAPFLTMDLLTIAVLYAYPQIATWLPSQM